MIAIIKYNAGNTASVKNAVERLGYDCIITDNQNELLSANKVILPGVGEAGSAMEYLRKRNLDSLILSLKQPVLGICLGQQLMCSNSEESDTKCLGIFSSKVLKFPSWDIVPHMGWNSLYNMKSDLFQNIKPQSDVYFVHSYFCEISEHTTAECNYILPFGASMQKDNFFATQFHPEKSAKIGEQILLNFLKL
jgi:imidazole glycerol-phosphate synthase subunit HisH